MSGRTREQLQRSNQMQHRDMQAMADRIKVLEGHRNQWRRIAFRLSDELEKHDEAAARAIFEAADVLPSSNGDPK